MKILINTSTDNNDMNRYGNKQEFLDAIKGLDGVELSYFGHHPNVGIIKDKVVGFHMNIPNYWYDFYTENEESLKYEFDSMEKCYDYYGGNGKDTLIKRIRDELALALGFGAEYLVFHVADCSFRESITFKYNHTHEEITDAAISLINEVFSDKNLSIKLLFENLWVPGLTFTSPEITKRLLDGIDYPDKGIMLDTGHLIHTNTSIRTQEEAIRYINEMLDSHKDVCCDIIEYIKGIHLNQSLSGEYIESMKNNSYIFKDTFEERYTQTFEHIFKMDKHEPFTCAGVSELIYRISPEYLVMEFITSDLEMQNSYKKQQLAMI